MVSTRRTSLRLQEKVASAPSSPVADSPTPTRARKAAASSGTGSATKKSPRTGSATKAKTPPKRGSKRATTAAETASDSNDATAETPSASEPSAATTDVTKELFHEHESSERNSQESVSAQDGSIDDDDDTQSELKSGESTEDDDASAPVMVPVPSAAVAAPVVDAAEAAVAMEAPADAVEVVTEPAAPAVPSVVAVEAKAAAGEEEEEEEEEEVLLLMDSDDDDDEDEDEEETAAKTEGGDVAGDDDDDDDISAYVQMAASGINLSTTAPSIPVASIAKPMRTALVPDALDSGASQHAAYFAFQGRANGATLLPAKRAEEEHATLAKQAHVTTVASRQRAEHANKKSAGRKWFDMESEELTPEVRRDFALLRMRNYLDPKKFYKTSDHHKTLPKHFQLGVVIEGAHEFKSARLTKKQRQQTFTDEIMADAGIQTYTKRVFGQIQAARSGQGKKKKAKTASRH